MYFLVNLLLLALVATSCAKTHRTPSLAKECELTDTCDAVVDPNVGKRRGDGTNEGDGTDNEGDGTDNEGDGTDNEGDGTDNEGDGTDTGNSGSAILNKLINKTPKEYFVKSGDSNYARARVEIVRKDDTNFSLEIAFTALRELNVVRHSSKYKSNVESKCKNNEVFRSNRSYYCYRYHELQVKLTTGSRPGNHANKNIYIGAVEDQTFTNGAYTVEINKKMVAGNSFRLRFNVPIADLADGSLASIFSLGTWSPKAKQWREFKSASGEKASASLKP